MTHHLAGQRFGKLVAIAPSGEKRHSSIRWHCKCDCGSDYFPTANDLVGGNTRSCLECSYKTETQRGKVVHGEGRPGRFSPTFMSWWSMRNRVKDPKKAAHFGLYIDPRWQEDFVAFKADMGERPEGKTLDRIDNEQGYFKGNCRWATPTEQSRNRKRHARQFTANGQTKYVADWARDIGVSYGVVLYHIKTHGLLPGPHF